MSLHHPRIVEEVRPAVWQRVAVGAAALVGVVLAASGRRRRAEEYVSVDHPPGELRLRLEPDGRFVLRLEVWDPVVGEFAGTRTLSGRWRQRRAAVELSASGRRIVYRSRGERLEWVRSSLPTFADGAVLALGGVPSRPRRLTGSRPVA
jgi:hypothetical protein